MQKWTIRLVNFLYAISLISIGFSSWTITLPPETVNVSGNFGVEQVFFSNEYLYLDTTEGGILPDGNGNGFAGFTYSASGFNLREEEESLKVDKSATFTVYFEVDLEKCKEEFFNYNSLSIQFTLGMACPNAVRDEEGKIEGNILQTATLNQSSAYTTSNLKIKTETSYVEYITLENVLLNNSSVFNFSLVYTFNVDPDNKVGPADLFEYFQPYAKLMSSDGFYFTLDAMISGAN